MTDLLSAALDHIQRGWMPKAARVETLTARLLASIHG